MTRVIGAGGNDAVWKPAMRTGEPLETPGEFKAYTLLLHHAGYYVPRSWSWGMSIRDGDLA